MSKIRKSEIELLKIVAIIIILISHSGPRCISDTSFGGYIDIYSPHTDLIGILNIILVYLGHFGNCIFIVSSSYFLLDSDKVNGKKILYLFMDTFFICVLSLVISFFWGGVELSAKDIYSTFLPITSNRYWFISCYLLIYAIHPLLNMVIANISQKGLLIFNFSSVFMYGFVQMIFRNSHYYNAFIGFIVIYFVVAYVKLYMEDFCNNTEINIKILLVSIVSFLVLIVLTNMLQLRYSIFANILQWCDFINPVFVIFGISIFNIFKSFNFKSKAINYVASLSLLIYIIHTNYYVFHFIYPKVWMYVYNTFTYKFFVVFVIMQATIEFIICFILGSVYRETIQKKLYQLCDKWYMLIVKFGNHIIDMILDK